MEDQLRLVIEGMLRGLKSTVGILEKVLSDVKSNSTNITIDIEYEQPDHKKNLDNG